MKKHILLIDDEREELGIFVQALNETHLPYKCTYAKDYTHALQMLEYLVPDFIFVDFNIPGMNCMDCLRTIKQQQKLQTVPVVVYSCTLTKEMADKASYLGIDFCIRKPSTVDDLSHLLADILLSEPKVGN